VVYSEVTLPPSVATDLWQRAADRAGRLFDHKDRSLRWVIVEAGHAAGVGQVGPHSFRHSHGTRLGKDGWSAPEIAARLGDSVQTVISVYMHAVPSFRTPRAGASGARVGQRPAARGWGHSERINVLGILSQCLN
jgi:integrase